MFQQLGHDANGGKVSEPGHNRFLNPKYSMCGIKKIRNQYQ
jgi:hypothetical protein